MSKQITRDGLLKIFFVTAFLVLTYMAFYPYMPAVTQRKNMAIAKEHCHVLETLISGNERYGKIRFERLTDERIWVLGFVKTEDDFDSLQKLVSDSNPPRPMKYHVEVEPLAFEE